jgi:photosystem II stability/assembly factor-like uncharacterized protein
MRGVILVGTAVTRPGAMGSLYRLEAGGAFVRSPDLPADVAVQAITADPTDPDRVYIAARKGLFVSVDAGVSWSQLDAPADVQYWSLLVDPQNPDNLFVGTSPVGVLRSHDRGKTWEKCDCDPGERYTITFGSSRMMKLAFHPTNPDNLYGAAEINGFYTSSDGGVTWRRANEGIAKLAEDPKLQNRELTEDETEGMYDAHAVTTTSAKPDAAFYVCRMGIFETGDQGASMRDLEVGRFAPFRYTRDVRVAPHDPKTLYACFSIASRSRAGAMYRSADVGQTWTRADPDMAAKSTIMGFGVHVSEAGGIASVTRHGQVFYTFDDGARWQEAQLPDDAGDAFCAAVL